MYKLPLVMPEKRADALSPIIIIVSPSHRHPIPFAQASKPYEGKRAKRKIPNTGKCYAMTSKNTLFPSPIVQNSSEPPLCWPTLFVIIIQPRF
jgi:hypothetical protein